MNSSKTVVIMLCLIGICALWFVMREPAQEAEAEVHPVVSLEKAYRLWSEDAGWEGTSAIMFDQVHRSGFKELKQAIARDPDAALSFYAGIRAEDKTGFAIAAAEAVGVDVYAKAREVGFDDLGDHLIGDFMEHVRLARELRPSANPDSGRSSAPRGG